MAIHDGLAAFAIEATAPFRNTAGVVVFYDTKTRSLAGGPNVVPVGALPDMLTFTHDGRTLLVANEATPNNPTLGLNTSNDYGPRLNPGASAPFVFGPGPRDPAGSVTIIDVHSRTVIATAGFAGVPVTGANVRTTTGMDFEPEYITVDHDGHTSCITRLFLWPCWGVSVPLGSRRSGTRLAGPSGNNESGWVSAFRS